MKRKRGKKKGKRVYAIISLTTSIIPIALGITGLITWVTSITDTAESEREAAESERQTFEFESQQLESSIQYAQEILPTYDMSMDNKSRINVELQRSMNELRLNNNIETSRSIYENVKNDLVNCAEPLASIEPPTPANVEEPWGIHELIIIGPLAVVSIIFGIKWYRSRKEVDVSDDTSTSAIQKP